MATEETVVMERTENAAPLVAFEPQAVAMPAAFDFVPKTLTEAMELSRMLAESSMVPKDFRNNAGNCFIAMQWGAELGFKALQALQNIAVINGKPGIYGDVGKALLLSRGYRIIEQDTEAIKASGRAECTIVAPNGAKTTRTFSMEDARQAKLWGKEGPWSTYPYRQMAWRAFWFAARDGAAHVLKGMAGVEELRDYESREREVTGEVVQQPETPKASRSADVAAQLKKPKIDEVVAAFAQASDEATLKSAIELAAKGGFEGEDKKRANAAYREATKRLAPPSDGPTPQDVRSLLTKARDNQSVEDAQTALSMVAGLKCDPEIAAALKGDCEAIIASLTPKAE